MGYPGEKGYRGVGMEGLIAKWYARNAERDLEDYRCGARLVSTHAPAGARVLELASGPAT